MSRLLPYLVALSLILCLISMLGWRLAEDTPAEAAFVRGSRLWIVSIGSGVGRVESFDGWPSDAPRQVNGVFLAPNWRGLRAFRS